MYPEDQAPVGDPVTPPPAEEAVSQAGEDGTDSAAPEPVDELAQLQTQLAERTDDLKRLQAEYVNYKRRVDRDRDLARRSGLERVLGDLLGVLDNIRSAREHEEMSDGFKAVANEIERVTSGHGLAAFGESGEAFDPQFHDAMMQTEQPGISEPTAADILQVGYRIGDKVVRPARVVVAQPAAGEPPVPNPQAGAVSEGPEGAADSREDG